MSNNQKKKQILLRHDTNFFFKTCLMYLAIIANQQAYDLKQNRTSGFQNAKIYFF